MAQELIKDKEAVNVLAALLRLNYANEFNAEHYNDISKVPVNTSE